MLLPLFNLNHSPFYYPEEAVDKAIEDKELSKDEMITLMGEDDDKEDSIPLKVSEEKEEDEEKEEEKDDELKELEEELEGPDDEKLELTTPVRRRDILTKYPKLFKDFPYLEHAYYREQQFTEIVPTIQDAKMAVEKSQILDRFESDITQGNLEKTIQAVKGSGEVAFNRMVDDYLPNLAKADQGAYLHVVGNIIKTTIHEMLEESNSSGDADLKAAAAILNQFIFRSNKLSSPTRLSKESDGKPTANEEVEKIRYEAHQERFQSAVEGLNTKVGNVLKSTIEANIDPRGSMSDYVKKNASQDCQNKLEEMLEGDRRLTVILDRLWEQSSRDRFSKISLDKIKSAYLSRAKSLLPTVIKQARQEALKGNRREENGDESTPKKGPLAPGRSTGPVRESGGKTDRDKAKAIPQGMSSREWLMKDD